MVTSTGEDITEIISVSVLNAVNTQVCSVLYSVSSESYENNLHKQHRPLLTQKNVFARHYEVSVKFTFNLFA